MSVIEPSANAAAGNTTLIARGLYIGERIDLRKYLPPTRGSAQQPAIAPVGDGSTAIMFRYGAIVFIDGSEAARTQFLRELEPLVEDRYERPESEEIRVCISAERREGVE